MKSPDKSANEKICSKCGVSKSITEFNFRNLEKNIKLSYCRECGKELTRSHYNRNKRQYTEKNLRAFNNRRKFAKKMKDRPCADCGIKYPFYVMDFDHREDEIKEFELNSLTRVTIKAVVREIAKCDVVCANCHRERTYRRRLKQNEKK
jgi:hypothetical protein